MRFKKYLAEEAGRFRYGSAFEEENARTLGAIIKNNGIFKSTKQRWYLLNKRFKKINSKKVSDLKKYLGVKVEEGQYWAEVDAVVKFGKVGAGHGTRWILWGYVLDDVGVVRKYKFKYIYRKDGSGTEGINKKKTKLEWERKNTPAVAEFRELVAQEDMARDSKIKASNTQLKNSKWIGEPGTRIKDHEIEEVVRKHYFETQYGESSITVIRDKDGNMIHHFGRNQLSKGDKNKIIDFTVKDHEEAEVNKWNKIAYKFTLVQRIKVK